MEARQRWLEQDRKDFQLKLVNLEHALGNIERRRDRRFTILVIGLAVVQIIAAFLTAYMTMPADSRAARILGTPTLSAPDRTTPKP